MGHREITYAPEDTEIRAGVGIGPYQLGMAIGELDKMLMAPDEREELPLHTRIKAGAFMFWIDKATGNLSQILVGQGFTGRFLDKIGIGSTLADVIAVAGDTEEEVDVYVLPDHPGICFELADADDWNELTAPIEAISVYPGDAAVGNRAREGDQRTSG